MLPSAGSPVAVVKVSRAITQFRFEPKPEQCVQMFAVEILSFLGFAMPTPEQIARVEAVLMRHVLKQPLQ